MTDDWEPRVGEVIRLQVMGRLNGRLATVRSIYWSNLHRQMVAVVEIRQTGVRKTVGMSALKPKESR